MSSNVEQKIVGFFDTYNIDRIVDYHNEIKRLFQNEICYINRKLDDETVLTSTKDNLSARKARYLNDYNPQMIITNFLMMFSYLEEYLFVIKARSNNKAELLKRKGSIGRFKEAINEINNNIVGSSVWEFFINAEKVRNCLLHANGRIDMMEKPNVIKSIIKSSNGMLDTKLERIMLSSDYISKFSKNIKSFYQLIK